MANPTFRVVLLELHGVGKYRRISTVAEAERCLSEHWPADKQHGEAFTAALLACEAAIDGVGSGGAVREALIAAAGEADIFIVTMIDMWKIALSVSPSVSHAALRLRPWFPSSHRSC
jgi:hypothetical protein